MARFALALAATLACSTSAWAQDAPAASTADEKKPEKWDVNAPPGMTTRKVPIAVDEGSWMNVDVSPDGRTLAFDLLGDIYTMPIEGSTPTRIAEGLAFDEGAGATAVEVEVADAEVFAGLFEVFGASAEEGAGEGEAGGVGPFDGLVEIFDAHYGEDGSEDFFLGDVHVIGNVGKNRW